MAYKQSPFPYVKGSQRHTSALKGKFSNIGQATPNEDEVESAMKAHKAGHAEMNVNKWQHEVSGLKGEGQDQDKIFNSKGLHVGNYDTEGVEVYFDGHDDQSKEFAEKVNRGEARIETRIESLKRKEKDGSATDKEMNELMTLTRSTEEAAPTKQLKDHSHDDPYTKEDYDFLREQREERVHATDYLTKTPVGPVAEKKNIKNKIAESVKNLKDQMTLASGRYKVNKAQKTLKPKTSTKKKDISQSDWEPAFPGADHSQEELNKMTKEEQEKYYN